MEAPTYALHGLLVRSAIPLVAHSVAGATPDLVVSPSQTAIVPSVPADGTLLARDDDERRGYAVTSRGDSHLIRFYGSCDFEYVAGLRSLAARRAPGVPEELSSIFLAANVLSCVLTLQGRYVVHASAVAIGDHAVAFVGPPHAGKSTVAAALCALGADLVTDDALRVELDAPYPLCHGGAAELRLRPEAARVARQSSGCTSRETADGRLALRPARYRRGPLPLSALVIPVLSSSALRVDLSVLSPREALIRLQPRVECWIDQAIRERQFRQAADLVRRVRCFQALLPHPTRDAEAFAPLLLALGETRQGA